MEVLDPDRAEKIKHCLKWQVRGMTITDVASRLKMNRNVVAKYLDMFLIAGQVEVREVGPTKVYSLSQRVPISAMLEFSSDSVIVLDSEQNVIHVNEPALKFLNVSRESLVGNAAGEIDNPFFRCLPMPEPVKHGDSAHERISETGCMLGGKMYHFRIKLVPTVFENGSTGATYIIEDITGKKEADDRINTYIKNLEFLARTSATFADMSDDEDIYQYIADRLAQLEPKAFINIMSINPETRMTLLRAVAGDPEISRILFRYFGSFFQSEVPMGMVPEAWESLLKGVLINGNTATKMKSLYEQTYRVLPEQQCNEIEKSLGLSIMYVMGCTCRMGIYGNVALRFRHNDDLTNRETVEAFVRQAGVALQRRYLREKLRKAEERIRVLEGRLSLTGPENSVAQSPDGS